MGNETSISHDEAMVKELRDRPHFRKAYLRAAAEDLEEPQVLRIALRRVREAKRTGRPAGSRETR